MISHRLGAAWEVLRLNELIGVVDDDESIRLAMARIIKANSYEVRTYGSAREFIDSLELAIPACLIVDFNMPGMTGLELLHYLADAGLRIPAIVYTAHDDADMRHRFALAGAIAFLVKPVAGGSLLAAIREAIPAAGPTKRKL